MRRAVCPGTFDPVTNGHLDIIARAAAIFDEVVVAVGLNQSKSRLFTAEERQDLIRRACADLPNVRVTLFSGLLTTFCSEQRAVAIVKGLRGAGDYDYELPMAHMNHHLTGVDTVFLPTASTTSFVSSSLVKEVAGLGGDVTGLVPDFVRAELLSRLRGEPGEGPLPFR